MKNLLTWLFAALVMVLLVVHETGMLEERFGPGAPPGARLLAAEPAADVELVDLREVSMPRVTWAIGRVEAAKTASHRGLVQAYGVVTRGMRRVDQCASARIAFGGLLGLRGGERERDRSIVFIAVHVKSVQTKRRCETWYEGGAGCVSFPRQGKVEFCWRIG